jgi:NO-binding membrane sensor protein with MHYT domain
MTLYNMLHACMGGGGGGGLGYTAILCSNYNYCHQTATHAQLEACFSTDWFKKERESTCPCCTEIVTSLPAGLACMHYYGVHHNYLSTTYSYKPVVTLNSSVLAIGL